MPLFQDQPVESGNRRLLFPLVCSGPLTATCKNEQGCIETTSHYEVLTKICCGISKCSSLAGQTSRLCTGTQKSTHDTKTEEIRRMHNAHDSLTTSETEEDAAINDLDPHSLDARHRSRPSNNTFPRLVPWLVNLLREQ